MKKLIIVLLIALSIVVIKPLQASEATTYTMTVDAKGNFIRTQDAYLPDEINISLGLDKPEDMMFDEQGYLWIADTGNKRIIKYDTYNKQVIQVITHNNFQTPKGIFVNNQSLYVADSSAKAVFRLTLEGILVDTFLRPESPSFADTAYAPNKIVVDNRGNLFIYGEGVSNGIIQLTNQGEFLGFFTTNKVELSIVQQFYKLVLSQEQFDRLALRSPQTFSSIFIDQNSMIYTSTMNTKTKAVKKHNMQGGNMFGQTIGSDDTRDIYVDHQGIVYAGTQSGAIYVYDRYGEFIYSFGVRKNTGPKPTDDIKGLFTSLAAIAVRDDGYVFALDETKATLQSFRPTDYSQKIYHAIALYEERSYEAAIDAWQSVLNLNQMSTLAHNSIAKSYLQLQAYDEAMHHFQLAGNKTLYSEAFWEVRNVTIQNMLGIVIIIGIIAYASTKTLAFVDKKTGRISKVTTPVKKALSFKIVRDLLYAFRIMKKPLDGFYELKLRNKGSFVAASILYVSAFIMFIVYSSSQGFIFQILAIEDLDLTAITIGYFLMTGMFMVSNYLDTSINDGVGSLKTIYLMFAYSLMPLILGLGITTLLSHILTLNEVFFMDLILNLGVIYTVVLIYLGIIEIHEYRGKKAFRSFLMSILFTLIMIVVVIIIITMWRQLYLFLDGVWKELLRNVFN